MVKRSHVSNNAINHSGHSGHSGHSNKGFVNGAVTAFTRNMNQFGSDINDFRISSKKGGYRHTRRRKRMKVKGYRKRGGSRRSRRSRKSRRSRRR